MAVGEIRGAVDAVGQYFRSWNRPQVAQKASWRQRAESVHHFLQRNGDIVLFQSGIVAAWIVGPAGYFQGALGGVAVAFYLYMGLDQKHYQALTLAKWQVVALTIVQYICLVVIVGSAALSAPPAAALWAARTCGFAAFLGSNLIRYR